MKRTLVLTALLLSACGRTRQAGPAIPFDEDGACPFQCCTYREWSVDWDTDLHTDQTRRCARGVSRGAQRYGHRTDRRRYDDEGGRATAKRPVTVGTNTFAVGGGEPIYLLRSTGRRRLEDLGQRHHGQAVHPEPGLLHGDKQSSDECALTVVEQPEIVWWAKVRDAARTRRVDARGRPLRQYRRVRISEPDQMGT
jgi:hypothetical protein